MKKLSIIVMAILLFTGTAFATPAFKGFITGSVGTCTTENPLLVGCDIYPGDYNVTVYANDGRRIKGIVIDYQAGKSPVILGNITRQNNTLHIATSTTLVIVAAPEWGEAELTILVFRK